MVVADRQRRSRWRSLILGLAVGVATTALGITVVALPLFLFAQSTEPARGVDRPFIRTGLVNVAVPAGLVLGVTVGALSGRWYRRGGALPREDGPAWRR